MPRTRPPYPPEFRAQLVALHQAGRTIAELAKEFEPSEATIHTWIAQAAVDERAAAAPRAERAGTLTTAEREELARLRRENRQLKVERDILGKAAVDSTGQRNRASKRAAGVSKSRVFRGREFSLAAT